VPERGVDGAWRFTTSPGDSGPELENDPLREKDGMTVPVGLLAGEDARENERG